jgi:hypothetical protein
LWRITKGTKITFFPENLAVCEIMWNNMAERGRPQMTIDMAQKRYDSPAG